MVAKMILPLLGGSPAVWNTCMAFFQIALLMGYLYAHLLQRFLPAKIQVVAHLFLLAAAALFLPLKITGLLSAPPVGAPVGWLLGVLVVSIGVPFAALSATAPLLQAWYGGALLQPQAQNPYILYAASTSAACWRCLPIRPDRTLLVLDNQTVIWAGVYVVFCLLMVAVGFYVCREVPNEAVPERVSYAPDIARNGRRAGRYRLAWRSSLRSSSLMLGADDVHLHLRCRLGAVPVGCSACALSLDVRHRVPGRAADPARARASLAGRVRSHGRGTVLHRNGKPFRASSRLYGRILLQRAGLSSTPCRQQTVPAASHRILSSAFAGRRPGRDVQRLPGAADILAGRGISAGVGPRNNSAAVADDALFAALSGYRLHGCRCGGGHRLCSRRRTFPVCARRVCHRRRRRGGFCQRQDGTVRARDQAFCLEAILVQPDNYADLLAARSFFGVYRVTHGSDPVLGDLHLMFHGTTIHGAQPQAANERCRATTYYANATPIGQAIAGVLASHPAARIGVVGLGVGTVASYTRAADRMRFFEIDPEVERIARDRRYFTYLSDCAKAASTSCWKATRD